MKKILMTMLGLAAVVTIQADGLSLQNRILLNRHKMEKDGKIKSFEKTPSVADNQFKTRQSESDSNLSESGLVRAFVRIAKGYSDADLEAAGMNVVSVRGDIAIVSMSEDLVEEISSNPCVAKLSLEKKLSSHMDMARSATGVDDIHSGKNLKMPYTGKGVLASIVDQGIDPNHIAFLNENGENRIEYLTYFDGTATSSGLPKGQYFGKDIVYQDDKGNLAQYPGVDRFVTDLQSTYHGTHTLNILGGGYKGNVTVVDGSGAKTVSNPYYGVAPDATLSVSCGDLSDLCVAMGIDEMLYYGEYRREVDNMPNVLSLSLGSTAGPHDPNNLMNEYLSYCGEDAIIVISAGNEGDLKLALNKTFTADDNSLKSMPYPYGFRYEKANGDPSWGNTYYRNDVIMFYSNDATPFTIKAYVMTGTPGNYRKRATFDLTSADGKYLVSDETYQPYVGGSVNSTVATYFDGFLGGGCMLDEDLGRYYGAFEYYLFTNPETGINVDGSEAAIIAFEIIGEPGQRIDCFCSGDNTWIYNYGLEGYQDGSRDGTISDMAVGDNILVVGAYNTRDRWTALDGRDYSYDNVENFKVGDIGPYSSYGTLPDGRTLPHVCAPGTAIMSAFSGPYIDYAFKGNTTNLEKSTTAKASVNGKDYYWKPETGTSMSTPFVAGSIALWLEADPSLTINDIYDIVEKTSVKDSNVMSGNPVQWGAGKFDALAGLKEVISRAEAGVKEVSIDGRNDRLILSEDAPGVFNVFVGNARNLDVRVFSVSGQQVFGNNFSGNEAVIDLSMLSSGIYVIKANNHTAKIFVK